MFVLAYIFDLRHALGDGDGLEGEALAEGIVADGGEIGWEGDGGDVFAEREFERLDGVSNANTREEANTRAAWVRRRGVLGLLQLC